MGRLEDLALSIEPHPDTRHYFRERLAAAGTRHATTAPPDVEAHLVTQDVAINVARVKIVDFFFQ